MELIERLGGVADPAAPASPSQVAALLRKELARGLEQVPGSRAGYDRPVVVAVAATDRLLAVVPADARVRSDPAVLAGQPRAALLIAAAVEALVLTADLVPVVIGAPLALRYGSCEGALVIACPWLRAAAPDGGDAELATLQVDDRLSGTDRLRVAAVVLPAPVAAIALAGLDLDIAIGGRHPLDELEVLARAGVAAPLAAHVFLTAEERGSDEPALDADLAQLLDHALGPTSKDHRPHEDPDPARRIARRMLQMLAGKRKWSGGTGAGYHTEVTHLTRGFERADRELAGEVLTALLDAGLLVEKVSVGQRHVSLLSRRAGDIGALIERGELPSDLRLPTR